MKYTKLILATAALLFTCAVNAQKSDKGDLKSYNFMEVQGGAQMTFTDAKKGKLITPVEAFSIGRYFSPVVGARLHVSGGKAKSGFDNIGYYKWNYVTTDFDMLFNLTNLFSKGKSGSHPLNVVFIGGIGLNNAWNNKGAVAMAAENQYQNMPLVWNGNRLSHNIRAGLRLETDVTKPFGVSLEVNANSLDDRFNSKMNDADDWQLTASLGVSFRFGHKYNNKSSREVIPATPMAAPVEKKPEPKVVTVIDTIYKKVPVKLHEERFYPIRESDASANAQMERIANFLKTYPEANVKAVGYADKGTGNPTINQKYSQQRVDNVKKTLVEKYGVAASRIITDAKGDSVQPFAENDKNRCVIVDGTAEKKTMETKSRQVTVNE